MNKHEKPHDISSPRGVDLSGSQTENSYNTIVNLGLQNRLREISSSFPDVGQVLLVDVLRRSADLEELDPYDENRDRMVYKLGDALVYYGLVDVGGVTTKGRNVDRTNAERAAVMAYSYARGGLGKLDIFKIAESAEKMLGRDEELIGPIRAYIQRAKAEADAIRQQRVERNARKTKVRIHIVKENDRKLA